jgi:hypothetical protein
MLIERLANVNAAPRQVLIGGELEVRESTGPARKVGSRGRATRRPRRTAAAAAGSAGNGTARG